MVSVNSALRNVRRSTMSSTKASTSGRTGSMRSRARDWRPLASAWTIPSPGSSPTAWQARIASASTSE